MDSLTVITATIPGREHLLIEAMRSVAAQTDQPKAHIVRCSTPPRYSPAHLAEQHRALLEMVDTEWLAILDDDNLWFPDRVETVRPYLEDPANDVVYTWAQGTLPRLNVNDWAQPRLVEYLRGGNFLDAGAFWRTQAIRDVGGFPDNWNPATGHFGNTICGWDDWWLALALAEGGKRFFCLPVETWEYRGMLGNATSTRRDLAP